MNPASSPKGETGERYPRRLYLALAALAAVSFIGLDYLASRRGERAYLFPQRPSRVAAAVPLADLAGQVFAESGIGEKNIRAARDPQGQPQFSVELTKEAYLGLAALLESAFRDHQARTRVEEGETEGRTTYSWIVRRAAGEKLTLLFSCLPPPSTESAAIPPAPVSPPPASWEKIAAIIIDDMGSSLVSLQEILDLGVPLTISVLPQSQYAMETAQTAHDHNLEVMLHRPGEALNHQGVEAPPPSPLIRSGMTADEIRAIVVDSLNRVPFVSGVNNHMGSRITQEKKVMTPVFALLKERRLFFIDSVTGNGSIAYDLARKMGLHSGYRNVFLDSEVGVDYSKKKLVELFRLAKTRGRAVGIGHPFPETLEALREGLSLSREYGVRLVLASQAIRD